MRRKFVTFKALRCPNYNILSGSKMRNVKSDVAFFIGNDTVETDPIEVLENGERHKNTEEENGFARIEHSDEMNC